VTAYLMTRGTPRRLDYAFLGDGPDDRWWAPLDDWVVLERPEVIVRGAPGGSGVLVSGIPSARRDAIGTPIRFTVVLEGAGADVELLIRLAAAGLDPGSRVALGRALDDAFGIDEVDATLAGVGTCADVDLRLVRVIRQLTGARPMPSGGNGRPAESDPSTSWAGSVPDRRAVDDFLDRIAQLARGVPGWAFTTAALTSENGARRAAEGLDGPVAILLEGGLSGVVNLGKAPDGRPIAATGRQRVRPAVLATAVVIPVLLIGLILAALGTGVVSFP
jgi:hypothetical protein